MKSCSECIFGHRAPCDNCNDGNENSEFISDDIKTILANLESENLKLEQRITELEKASDEFERIANKATNQHIVLIDENDELKQELEARERMIEERNRIIRLQVGWVDEARKERDDLKQELEVHKTAFENLAASCGIVDDLKEALLSKARKELTK